MTTRQTANQKIDDLTNAIKDLSGLVEAQNKRIAALEKVMHTGWGALVGGAAVLGFLIFDGLSKLKAFLGYTPS
jgi:hypothetical protein